MWIMFESPQVINKEPDTSEIGVQALPQGGSSIVSNTTTLATTDKSKPPTPLVFTFTAEVDKQIMITFPEKTPLPGTGGQNLMDIYESDGRNGKPFLKLNSNQLPPLPNGS